MSKAANLAEGFNGDAKGLPRHVQEAIADVEAHVENLDRRVRLAEELHAIDPTHPLALEPEKHGQSTAAYRYEEVDGEIVEIRKDSARAKTRIIHRPGLVAMGKEDPASALEAMLRADEPVASDEE